MDRFIIVCPTFQVQSCFRFLDNKVNSKRDVFTEPDDTTFKNILKQLLKTRERCIEKNLPMVKTLLFVDDMAGTKYIHGGRTSAFGNLCIQSPHLSTTILCISQQPTAITPSFRDNVNAVMAFPSRKIADVEYLEGEFGGEVGSKLKIRSIIEKAWNYDDEYGQHFLFVYSPPRSKSRFFIDFNKEIII